MNHIISPVISSESSSACCGYVRMAPAVVTLVTSTMGVAICLFYKMPYLSIPFGGGCLSSAYLCYLAHEYRHLKDLSAISQEQRSQLIELHSQNETFKESNEQLVTSLETFERQNAALSKEVERSAQTAETLGREVLTLVLTNQQLGSTASRLETENADLNRVKTGLQEQILQLQSANTTLDSGLKETTQLYQLQLDRLQSLNQALSTMKETNSSDFNELMSALSTKISVFNEENAKLKSQQDMMTETATRLKDLLAKVNAWQSDETRRKLINDLEMLHKLNAQIQTQVGAAHAQCERLKIENGKLDAFNHELSSKLKDLKSQVTQLGQETTGLGKIKTELGALVVQLKSP